MAIFAKFLRSLSLYFSFKVIHSFFIHDSFHLFIDFLENLFLFPCHCPKNVFIIVFHHLSTSFSSVIFISILSILHPSEWRIRPSHDIFLFVNVYDGNRYIVVLRYQLGHILFLHYSIYSIHTSESLIIKSYIKSLL